MIDLKKKTKLVKLLKKLGDANPESLLVDDILREIQSTKASIPSPYDERPLVNDLNTIKSSISSISNDIGVIGEQFRNALKELSDNVGLSLTEKNTAIESLEKKLKNSLREVEVEMLARFSNLGGGSMNRQIKVNGVDYLTKYTDINLIGSITASDDNTAKRVDITFAAGGTNIETPVGTVDGSNTIFTVSNEPTYILVDGVAKYVTEHYTYVAGTITIIDGAPPVQTIRSIY